jgi:hypothetical protein
METWWYSSTHVVPGREIDLPAYAKATDSGNG